MSYGSEVTIYAGMLVKCYDSTNKTYPYYGGRGITVCERWISSFENFIKDMGPRPSKEHSIDRIDNNGNYEPSNCRWATKKEQANNRRSNRMLTLDGVTKPLQEWAKERGLRPATVSQRLNTYGHDIEKALSPDSHAPKPTMLTHNGRTQSISDWSKETGINISTIKQRIYAYGWSVEKTLTTLPITPGNRNPKGRPRKNKQGEARLFISPRLDVKDI